METAKHRTQISLEYWQYQILLEMSKKEKRAFHPLSESSCLKNFQSRL